jgi:hypothetical protein
MGRGRCLCPAFKPSHGHIPFSIEKQLSRAAWRVQKKLCPDLYLEHELHDGLIFT